REASPAGGEPRGPGGRPRRLAHMGGCTVRAYAPQSSAVEAHTPAEAQGDAVTEPAAAEGARHSRRRLWGMRALVVLGCLLLVLGALAVWVKRVALDPGTWSDTSARALQNETVRQTLATYLVDQLYANVDVAGRIRTALPER